MASAANDSTATTAAATERITNPPEGRKIVIRKGFLIDNIDLSLLPSDNRGEVNVSLSAVGDLLRPSGRRCC
jgi:hypothetical protein